MSAQTETKVALVTGSSSGIGQATAILLSQKGYRLAICGSNSDKVDRVVRECSQLGSGEPLGLVLDFGEPKNGRVAVERTVARFGRLDVLVNNAGIFNRTPGLDLNSYGLYKQITTINTDATVECSLAAVEHLKKTNGSLIFISSVASIQVHQHSFAYCMSKAAMSMFAKCLAIDLAPNVRVNIVSPGPVKTEIMQRNGNMPPHDPDMMSNVMKLTTLQQRIGQPEEVAAAIYFLIADTGSFVHGHELFVDGGYLLKMKNATIVED